MVSLLIQLYITHWFAFDMFRNIIFSNYFKKIIVQFCELFVFSSKLLIFFCYLAIVNRLKFKFRIMKFRSQIGVFFGWIVIIVVYSLPQTFNFLWIFPTFGEGKLGKLSFLQCIFTPSKVPALKMAGNVVWALYNTAASAEYKSVPFIWFFKEQFFGHCGSFCFYHSKNFN